MIFQKDCSKCKYTTKNGFCNSKLCEDMSNINTYKPCGVKGECPCLHCGQYSNFIPIEKPKENTDLRKLLNRRTTDSLGDISDGYNTFDDLYRQIAVLVDILIKQYEIDTKLMITLKETKDDTKEDKNTHIL
jgi:hypothetical protein